MVAIPLLQATSCAPDLLFPAVSEAGSDSKEYVEANARSATMEIGFREQDPFLQSKQPILSSESVCEGSEQHFFLKEEHGYG